MHPLTLGALALVLGACTATSSGCGPALVTYPRDFQREAAAELPKAGPRTRELVDDYSKTRDAIRKCRSR